MGKKSYELIICLYKLRQKNDKELKGLRHKLFFQVYDVTIFVAVYNSLSGVFLT